MKAEKGDGEVQKEIETQIDGYYMYKYLWIHAA